MTCRVCFVAVVISVALKSAHKQTLGYQGVKGCLHITPWWLTREWSRFVFFYIIFILSCHVQSTPTFAFSVFNLTLIRALITITSYIIISHVIFCDKETVIPLHIYVDGSKIFCNIEVYFLARFSPQSVFSFCLH